MKKAIIAGGCGLIGVALAEKLAKNNFDVTILSRNFKRKNCPAKLAYWNPAENKIDLPKDETFEVIINLAGENIAEKRWTQKRKKEISESRVNATKTLFNFFSESRNFPSLYIGASAAGYYGSVTENKYFSETDIPGNDFLANVCVQWENKALKFKTANCRTVIFRIGLAFSKNGGAFPKMTQSLKFGVIGSIGSGKQIIPWIHIDDLTEMILFAINNRNVNGIYNAVSHAPVSFDEFVSEIRKIKKAIRLPNVPAIAIKLIFGEMSSILLEGSPVSAKKIIDAGFDFTFKEISSALQNLLD